MRGMFWKILTNIATLWCRDRRSFRRGDAVLASRFTRQRWGLGKILYHEVADRYRSSPTQPREGNVPDRLREIYGNAANVTKGFTTPTLMNQEGRK